MTLGLLVSPYASAQPRFIFEGEALWWWEASADRGATWTRGAISVPQSQDYLLVRSWIRFPPVQPGGFLNGVDIDPTITAVGRDVINDQVSNVVNLVTGFPPHVHTPAFGNVRKIDHVSDSLPPGEGPAWVSISQPVAVGGRTDNPIATIGFRLTLDGTAGDRIVDGPFYQPPWAPPGHVVTIAMTPLFNTDILVPFLIVDPLTIHVVPSPGGCLALAVGMIAVRRQRRG